MNTIISRIVAFILLLLIFPLLVLIGIAISLTSRGPAVYKQRRIGKNSQMFTIWKLRTMYDSNKKERESLFPNKDEFVTPVGKVIRTWQIDELPQLLNIIRGEMAWVGPRPLRVKLVNYYNQQIRLFAVRHQVSPGLTGLAQILEKARGDRTLALACDLYYKDHKSARLDISILLGTLVFVLYRALKKYHMSIQDNWLKQIQDAGYTDISKKNNYDN